MTSYLESQASRLYMFLESLAVTISYLPTFQDLSIDRVTIDGGCQLGRNFGTEYSSICQLADIYRIKINR